MDGTAAGSWCRKAPLPADGSSTIDHPSQPSCSSTTSRQRLATGGVVRNASRLASLVVALRANTFVQHREEQEEKDARRSAERASASI